ncbi:MAG: ABC transporter substrate-binding protein [Alphaproteobacteria bacterium]
MDTSETSLQQTTSRRKFLKASAGAAALGVIGARAPAVLGRAKEFKGVTLNGSCFQHAYTNVLREFLPEFEAKSGMKVNFETPAFPIYNQRADLDLSTRGSGWDFLNITFIYSGRWVGSGWMSSLEEFLGDRNATPPDWEPGDFVSGAQASLTDAKGTRYGFAWEAGAMIMAASRVDLIEKAGMKLPETFEELGRVCEAVDGKDGVKAFVNDSLHHWHWPPYLMGWGGKVFADPPEDLTPTLDTREAAESAGFYGKLLREYSPSGTLSYTFDQAAKAHRIGRANLRTQAIAWLVPLAHAKDSTVRDTVQFGYMPRGPAGAFPGSVSHGFGIPLGAKNKRAAWEFIKWALSKEMVRRAALEKGYIAVCRKSVINDPQYRKNMTFSGQDVAALYLRVLEDSGRLGYMRYRMVSPYPQVGDKMNKAIERIATRQQSAKDAMAQAQRESILDLKKAGIKIRG